MARKRELDVRPIYYIYEWFKVNTLEVFYVGKGKEERLHEMDNRNDHFLRTINKYDCDVRIYKSRLTEQQAFELEIERIRELKLLGQAQCNYTSGGEGCSNWTNYVDEETLKKWRESNAFHSKGKEHPASKEIKIILRTGEILIFGTEKECAEYFNVTPMVVSNWTRIVPTKWSKRSKLIKEIHFKGKIIKYPEPKEEPRIAENMKEVIEVITEDGKVLHFLNTESCGQYFGFGSPRVTINRWLKGNAKISMKKKKVKEIRRTKIDYDDFLRKQRLS
ncbi:GIY-YIG nuclease family protein [Priestia megaterium]|uniref:hypothetical protein n=1 Tax=Priestia megaterium TaxID=1404 RepID=UPI002D80AF70|nr:hypothetical protein [Priestia megaterium]MEB4857288.1 hypothetical protein [Priestia megaterium]